MSDDAPLAPKSAYDIREDMHMMIKRDLLGPAGGEDEELHLHERRVRDRYLVGLLAPRSEGEASKTSTPTEPDPEDVEFSAADSTSGEELGGTSSRVDASHQDKLASDTYDSDEEGSADDNLSGKDSFFPSSMGMSFVVGEAVPAIVARVSWGQYKKIDSETQRYINEPKGIDKVARVWKRQAITPPPLLLPLVEGEIGNKRDPSGIPYCLPVFGIPEVRLQGKMRLYPDIGWIVTLFLVNNYREARNNKDEAWVFQPHLRVYASSESADPAIFVRRSLAASHQAKVMDRLSQQENSTLEMQYRHRLDFAVGHGVSVHVTPDERDPMRATSIETTFLPFHDVPQQTPPTARDIPELEGIILDMRTLAELPKADLLANLTQMLTAYEQWIHHEAAKVYDPEERLEEHQGAFARVIAHCQEAKERMQAGIACLADDDDALAAFRFSNHAMALQRVRTVFAAQVRRGQAQPDDSQGAVDIPANRSWRLFQLAFILLNLPSLSNPHHPERAADPDAVADLLWFPTGGGKTEAYLGLSAFTLAMRRLQAQLGGYDAENGVGVLMRYTLRLLTLQQFQRAAALMCACEVLRRNDSSTWGTTPFRLGLWVGSSSTPNHLRDADEALKSERGDGKPAASGNPRQLTHCPWCGREIKSKDVQVHHGKNKIGRCLTYCSDSYGSCAFSPKQAALEGLPVLVVDEDIYRHPPALLIATVDKFAQMPWQGNVQMLFGRVSGLCQRHGFLSPDIEADEQYGCKGNHPKAGALPSVSRKEDQPYLRPPDLIIQDELHLISGPLGSMVGLYEAAIDDLSTWQLSGQAVRPKVIASTATVRRAPDQVKHLFMRDVRIFPPQGSSIGDNFFSLERPASPEHPGRRYLGVCAFGRRFTEALIRVYIACLGSGQSLYEQHGDNADPYMTLVGYFNSIRELAGAKRLSEDDIRARLRGDITSRRGFAKRYLNVVEELTSRRSSQEIPSLLNRLEVGFKQADDSQRKAYGVYKRNKRNEGKKNADNPLNPLMASKEPAKPPPRPFDVLLATNMISVGVDIDRLGLMVAAGQPKNTAEYIQASSRVGRSKHAPGLVVTLYNWARPRDLSHFETFEHYHATFYKHVEALSVTPFALRALDRGLAGVMTGMVRLRGTDLSANAAAQNLQDGDAAMAHMLEVLAQRAENVTDNPAIKEIVSTMLHDKRDYWLKQVRKQRETHLVYKQRRTRKQGQENAVSLLERIEDAPKHLFAVMNSLRNVESSIPLMLDENARGLGAEDGDIFVSDTAAKDSAAKSAAARDAQA